MKAEPAPIPEPVPRPRPALAAVPSAPPPVAPSPVETPPAIQAKSRILVFGAAGLAALAVVAGVAAWTLSNQRPANPPTVRDRRRLARAGACDPIANAGSGEQTAGTGAFRSARPARRRQRIAGAPRSCRSRSPLVRSGIDDGPVLRPQLSPAAFQARCRPRHRRSRALVPRLARHRVEGRPDAGDRPARADHQGDEIASGPRRMVPFLRRESRCTVPDFRGMLGDMSTPTAAEQDPLARHGALRRDGGRRQLLGQPRQRSRLLLLRLRRTAQPIALG